MSPETSITEVSDQASPERYALASQRSEVGSTGSPQVSDQTPPDAQRSTLDATRADDWLPIWRIAALLNCTHRHARRELTGIDPALIRYQPQERGAPIKLYHKSAHPALAEEQKSGSESGVGRPASGVRSPS